MLISKPIMKKIILVWVIKPLIFINKKSILNGYHIESELVGFLKSGYHKYPLGYNNIDWFVEEVVKLKNKKTFSFKSTKKDIVMTEENEEHFRNNNICRFFGKNNESDKVRDHCHLTGKYRSPAHNICNFNVTKGQSNSMLFIFHNFGN